MRVLVVEDYAAVREAVVQALREEGFVVDEAETGVEGRMWIETVAYDVVVLDVMLPGASGLDLLAEMREKENITPVLMLTALDGVDDKVRGLDCGADDYLAKPFAIPELIARVRALVRRRYGDRSPQIRVGELSIDTATHEVELDDRPISLTAREFALLEYLARRVDQVVSREEICDHIYDEPQKTSNVVDVYVGYLRRKLEEGGGRRLIHTRRGAGYVLTARAEAPA